MQSGLQNRKINENEKGNLKMKRRMALAAVILTLTCVTACGKGEESKQEFSISEPITEGISSEAGAQEDSKAGDSTGNASAGNTSKEGEAKGGPEDGQKPDDRQEETGESQAKADGAGAEFGFENLSGWAFYFSSGAGGWYTELSINGDGTFRGHYQDADMGDTGDGYPGGTLYYSDFTGKFEDLEKVDELTYKMRLADIDFENQPGQEEIINETLYIYSTAYGIDGGEEFYLYLPGTRIEGLPEEYRQWVGYYNMEAVSATELSFYGLYNVKEQNGFSSNLYEEKSLSERIAAEISYGEEQDEILQAKLQEAGTQTDMNLAGAEILKNWDDTLNAVWGMLMAELDEADKEALRKEEREWIADKDTQAAEAGSGSEGGSIHSLTVALKAAELTKERVYELAEYAE